MKDVVKTFFTATASMAGCILGAFVTLAAIGYIYEHASAVVNTARKEN